jgi:hypothetical protein
MRAVPGFSFYTGDMLLAFLLAASVADWVPVRWPSGDVATLDLLKGTAVNCILLEPPAWSREFSAAAAKQGVDVFGVVKPSKDALEQSRKAKDLGLAGVSLEGEFDDSIRKALGDSKIRFVEIGPRSHMRMEAPALISATSQGVWPGINTVEDAAKAAPSGGPWIDTNTGFLRFARAASDLPVWIANSPPPKTIVPVERYLQAIGDAAMSGARWVVTFEDDFAKRLMAHEPAAVAGWARITQLLGFLEEHKEWREWRPGGEMAVVQDVDSGALLSGGVLDMIAVKHTPVRPAVTRRLNNATLKGASMAVNVDPASLNDAQKQILREFTRSGGSLLTGPPGWKFPSAKPGEITLAKEDLEKLDAIWKELNTMTGRRNLGARLFNVSSMLSNLLVSPDGKQTILHLVNYSNYPVDSVTVHLTGSYKRARIYQPGKKPQDLAIYPIEEGTGVDIDQIKEFGTLLVE